MGFLVLMFSGEENADRPNKAVEVPARYSVGRWNSAFIAVYCGLGTDQSFEHQASSAEGNSNGRNACLHCSAGASWDISRAWH